LYRDIGDTMVGITSYGAYVPLHRLGPETKGWGFPSKAVGYYDEDSLTMAVAAALDCIGGSDRSAIEGMYFASTTAPYKEKLTAATAAIFRLYAGKCKVCGTIQYPPQRICTRCRAKDSSEPVRLSDRRAKIFTYTLDNLAQIPAFDLPMVDSIIDFEGGGRGCFQMTDRDPREVKVGMNVEMTFRKLHTAGEMNNYFWKCTPVRDAGPAKESK